MLGRIVGALSSGRTPCQPRLTVLDMCAGDGYGSSDSDQSSPAIIARHMHSQFPGSERLRARRAHFYEREEQTFARLKARFGEVPSMALNMEDSKGLTLRHLPLDYKECVFIYADPNSITTLPVTDELIDSMTNETLFLMTMGCNVGGCKRLPLEDRIEWLKTARRIASSMQRRHDILLLWLVNDSSQWAYMAAVPKVWAGDTLAAAIKKGNAIWRPGGVDGLSLRLHGSQAIDDKFKELFLTREENATSHARA